MELCGDREIDRSHHLVPHLDNRHVGSGLVEVLGHLQPDKSGSDHHRTPNDMLAEVALDAIGIGHIAEREDPLKVDAGQRRTNRRSPGRQEQLVVTLDIGCTVSTANGDVFGRRINGHHFALRPHIDRKTATKSFGRLHKKPVTIGYRTPDIIGQPTVGIGDIRPLFEQDDLGHFVGPTDSCCCGGSSGHSADNQVFHGALRYFSINLTGAAPQTGRPESDPPHTLHRAPLPSRVT